MEEEVKVKTKLKIVLNELIKNDFRVTDDTIFEKLITHLSKTGIGSQVLDVPCCVKWVHSVILSWQCCKINANVMTFALRLLAIIVENESSFHYIQSPASFSGISCPESPDTNDSSLLLLLQQVCTAASTSNSNFSIKCAMVQFLSSLLKHQSGRKWIMLSGLWREVHTMSLNDSSIYVVRDSRRFLSNLLNEMPASQESELEAVLRYILEPITEVASFGELPSDNSKVLGSLHLASEIIQNVFLTTDTKTLKMHSPVAGLILKPNCTLLPKCLDATKVCKIIEVEELVSKIAVLMYILTATKDGIARAGLGNKAICILILDVFNDLINKGSVENVLKLCVVCHNHWTYASKIRNYAVENNIDIKLNDGETKVDKRYRFEDQLLCIQLSPVFCIIMTTPTENTKELYLYKLADKSCFEAQRVAFSFRSMVLQQQKFYDLLAKTVKSVMGLTLPPILPGMVGLAGDVLDDDMEEYLQKLTSLMNIDVHRMIYSFRDVVIAQSNNEQLASFSVASIKSLKRVLTRLTPLFVGCTIGDSTLESYFQIQWAQRLDFNVMRSMYTLRDFVVKSRHLMDRSALQSVATLCSLIARNVNPEIERERAVLVFQSFIYVLKHFVVCANSETKQGGWGGELRESHYSTLLVAILDGLANLIRSHRITWRESVESFCLLTLAQNLLDNPTFSSKAGLVVQALQLIQLCIENFMPPNLALLTNSLSGTGLEHLGPLIFKRLHDPNWEVRDSSLEVLLTLATISYTKYPLFQELILDSKLCEVVVQLSINDAEVYVCASATKCLTAMVKVDRLWNEELNDKDLVNKMIGILNGESEGVLRREASLLMSQIFKYRKVPLEVLGNMCVTMANVVLSDLHWEVKVNALNFWELIIEHQMNDQGMIDGVFPQVTFSKEHRKIINLTPAAIQERLKKVLAELSRNGCLYVLLQAVCTDEDLEVVKKASQIISSLSVVLEKHGLLDLSNTATLQSQSFEATVLKDLKHETNQFDHIPDTPDSLWSVESNEPSQTGSGTYKPEQCSSLNPSECLNPPGKSILDLDPQMMGFAALTDDDDFHSVPKSDLQEKVIDSILNDRDIHLLAKVYLGTNAEEPGRRGPETKISKPVRPLVILSSGDFLHQLTKLDVDKIVKEKIRWIEDTGDNLETLLDDMLISRNIHTENEEDCNAMDCY